MSIDITRINDALHTQYWSWTFLNSDKLPSTLLDLLKQTLIHIEPSSWSDRFEFGGVYINGYPILQDTALSAPCRIEYYEPKFDIKLADQIYPKFDTSHIIWADGDLAAVYKPAKLPSMPAKEQRYFSLKAGIEKIVGHRIHMPSRLDLSVAGIVLVSTSERMHAPLQKIFESREVIKNYRFASHLHPKWNELFIDKNIDRDFRHPVLRRVVEKHGQKAQTKINYIAPQQLTAGSAYLFAAQPITGRTHQIRVHAQYSNIPIIGDNFYAGLPAEELHLLSCQVQFRHPFSKQLLCLQLPKQFVPKWSIHT